MATAKTRPALADPMMKGEKESAACIAILRLDNHPPGDVQSKIPLCRGHHRSRNEQYIHDFPHCQGFQSSCVLWVLLVLPVYSIFSWRCVSEWFTHAAFA